MSIPDKNTILSSFSNDNRTNGPFSQILSHLFTENKGCGEHSCVCETYHVCVCVCERERDIPWCEQ